MFSIKPVPSMHLEKLRIKKPLVSIISKLGKNHQIPWKNSQRTIAS
jgi:hypothetical protein